MSEPITFNFDKNAIIKMATSSSLQDQAGFFEFLRHNQYQKLAQCASEEQRIEIQQSVKGINHIQNIFKRMYEDKKFPA